MPNKIKSTERFIGIAISKSTDKKITRLSKATKISKGDLIDLLVNKTLSSIKVKF